MDKNLKNLDCQCHISVKSRVSVCPVAMYCAEHYILFTESRYRKIMDFFYNIRVNGITPATAAKLQDICKDCSIRAENLSKIYAKKNISQRNK